MDRPSSAALRDGGESSSLGRGSRPNSVLSAGQLSSDNVETLTPPIRPISHSIATQTIGEALDTPPQEIPTPKPEILTYNKGVQTDTWTEPRRSSIDEFGSDGESSPTSPSRASKRLSRRERERDEEIRESLRKEIEDELKAIQDFSKGGNASSSSTQQGYPLRTLTNDELDAVTSSVDFLDFVDRSSKVIERTLDEEYDVLADYALGGVGAEEDEEEEYGAGKRKRELKQVAQFWDERWSKKRMISDINFSPKVRSSACYFEKWLDLKLIIF